MRLVVEIYFYKTFNFDNFLIYSELKFFNFHFFVKTDSLKFILFGIYFFLIWIFFLKFRYLELL